MRTLAELRQKISPIPRPFASEASDFPYSVNDTSVTTYKAGFPEVYSKDPNSANGRYVLRNDMNALGKMATTELNFREAGGIHTFDDSVSGDGVGGYPREALLNAFDGEFLSSVESQESGNKKSFLKADGTTDYGVVNCKVAYEGEADEEKRIMWKSVNWIEGLESAEFHLDVNYSGLVQIEDGEEVPFDAIVIGTNVLFVALAAPGLIGIFPETRPITDSEPLHHSTKISLPSDGGEFQITEVNKGRFGDALGSGVYILSNGLHEIPVCSYTGGTGNYFLSVMAKKGTVISADLWQEYNGRRILSAKPFWYAVPLIARAEVDYD